MDRLDQLKAKYSSALEAMSQQGLQISAVTLKDDKLFVQGTAPSEDAKNIVWNQIKAIDGNYADLICDIRVGASNSGPSDLHEAAPESLAGGLAQLFRSPQGQAFPELLSNLFNNSDGQQRAGLLNHLIAAAGPGVLASALPAGLGSLLKSGNAITPEQAQQIPPESIQNIAEHAQKSDPSVIDQISGFYSQHPKVVQALGAGALAMIMSHMNKR